MAAAFTTPKKIGEGSNPMMCLNKIRFGVIGALFIGTALIAVPTFAQSVAYTHATLETLSDKGRIENGTLVVEGDKIVAVGEDIEIPSNAKVVSMKGKTIMPGLVDPYFVFSTSPNSSGTRTIVFNGRTFTIPNRNPTFSVGSFTRMGEYFYPFKFNFESSVRTGITAANLVSDGRGLSAFAHFTGEQSTDIIFKKEGHLFAKITNQTSALDIVRKPLAPSKASSSTSKTTKTSTSSRSSSSTDNTKELWEAVKTGKAPLFVNANNPATIAYLLKFLKENEKVKVVLVATGSNLYQLVDEIKANKQVSVVLQPAVERIPFTTNLMNVSKILNEKEIPFAFSMSLSRSQMTATQDDPLFPLAMLVRTGLPRNDAFEAVTIKPAKMLGIEKTHGSLEKDKFANLLIFDGDPLATGSRLEKVILNGKTVHEN